MLTFLLSHKNGNFVVELKESVIIYKTNMAHSNSDKWFNSSSGSGDLSLTIKGLLVLLIPVIVGYAATKGVPLTETLIVDTIEAGTAALSALMVAWGLFRKIVVAFNK